MLLIGFIIIEVEVGAVLFLEVCISSDKRGWC